LVEAEKSFI